MSGITELKEKTPNFKFTQYWSRAGAGFECLGTISYSANSTEQKKGWAEKAKETIGSFFIFFIQNSVLSIADTHRYLLGKILSEQKTFDYKQEEVLTLKSN